MNFSPKHCILQYFIKLAMVIWKYHCYETHNTDGLLLLTLITYGNVKFLLNTNNKSKAAWQIINKETGRTISKTQDIIISKNSKEISNPEKVAELFNSYFCKIPEKLSNKNGRNTPTFGDYQFKIKDVKSMFFVPITENEVEKVAKDFKNKLSAGVDEIPDYVVKQCIKFLKEPLTDIYNTSLESGIFPDKLKTAKVIPLHKKGNIRDIQNYRPIASSVFSKLLEKLVYNSLMAFIEGNGILTEEQHGFRMNRSTESALQSFIGGIQEAIDKQMNPIGLFLNLAKAYDVLDHKLLLFKLSKYG